MRNQIRSVISRKLAQYQRIFATQVKQKRSAIRFDSALHFMAVEIWDAGWYLLQAFRIMWMCLEYLAVHLAVRFDFLHSKNNVRNIPSCIVYGAWIRESIYIQIFLDAHRIMSVLYASLAPPFWMLLFSFHFFVFSLCVAIAFVGFGVPFDMIQLCFSCLHTFSVCLL